jgi:hypothetical protein
MAESVWAAVKIELLALVNGIPFEVVQALTTYERNSIPSCTVTVAVGREVTSGQAAAIHAKLDRVQIRNPFELFLYATPLGSQGGAPNAWPAETKLFDGEVTGSGWERGQSGAQFTIHAEHWLADLNYSSALSGSSHPGNPANFTYSAGFQPMNVTVAGGGLGGPLQWIPGNLVKSITKADIENDLWEDVLKKWMQAVSEDEPIDDRLGDPGILQNDAALDALAKIKSAEMGMDLGARVDSEAIGNSLALALNSAITLNDVHTTLWGKLIGEWSPQFFFALIPRVEDALIVPFCGALRQAPEKWATFKAGDYVQCSLNCALPHLLRCVAIAYPVEFTGGGNLDPGFGQAPLFGVAGLYPIDSDKKGLVLIKDAPLWMSQAAQGLNRGAAAAGVVPRVPIQHSATKIEEAAEDGGENLPEDNERDWIAILDAYAQQWYVHEMLKGRVGEISGRLRFDIAPGSQVLIEAGIDPFIADPRGREDLLGKPLYGCVERVTHMINSELRRAGSSFTIAHLRTEAENESDDTSVAKPPLYKKGWLGASLIDDYKPDQ